MTGGGDLLSVEGEIGLDDTGVESQRLLGIFRIRRRSSGVGICGSRLYGRLSTTELIHKCKLLTEASRTLIDVEAASVAAAVVVASVAAAESVAAAAVVSALALSVSVNLTVSVCLTVSCGGWH